MERYEFPRYLGSLDDVLTLMFPNRWCFLVVSLYPVSYTLSHVSQFHWHGQMLYFMYVCNVSVISCVLEVK